MMKYAIFGRLAGALLLSFGLAACVDMTQEVNVTSDTTAKATMTMTMAADIYGMLKGAAAGQTSGDKFCNKEHEKLTENADGSATCTSTEEGAFADLSFEEGGRHPTFTLVSAGLVRVSIPTAGMAGALGQKGAASDAQQEAMITKMFDGHFVTIRVSGKQITDTNLTLSDDKTSAEIKIPFLDLIKGTAKLPEELYAVVATN
jgi:hypothetical protein